MTGIPSSAAPGQFQLSRIGQWSKQEWGAVGAIAAILLGLKLFFAPSDSEIQQLRTQFHLPDGISLLVDIDRKQHTWPWAPADDLQGMAQFSEAQFNQYVAQLDDRSIWKPSPVVHGGRAFVGPFETDAFSWSNSQDARQLEWGRLSWKQAAAVSNGRTMCFHLNKVAGSGEATFRGEKCPPHGSPTTTAVFVQGLLDFDTKTLHMLIRETRAPH